MLIIMAMNDFDDRNVNLVIEFLRSEFSAYINPDRIRYGRSFMILNFGELDAIRIEFKPTLPIYLKGMRPDYYWTDSDLADMHLRTYPNAKCLYDFTELINMVKKELMRKYVFNNGGLGTMQHDRYDTDILKQLTRIANSLEKIEKKIQSEPSSLGQLLVDKGLIDESDLVPWVKVEKINKNKYECPNCNGVGYFIPGGVCSICNGNGVVYCKIKKIGDKDARKD